MSVQKFFMCFILFLLTTANAAEIERVTMISLAESGNPWTIAVDSDGTVELKLSSSGYLLDSLFGDPDDTPKMSTTIDGGEVTIIFRLVADAGYGTALDHGQEPKIKLVVTLSDGSEVVNSGPNNLETNDRIVSFRDIERAIIKAAGYDFEEEVAKYQEASQEPYLFLFYSVVYSDM